MTIVFIDESGFYLLPGVVRTYAPRAQTPILKTILSYAHLSVMSGITMQGHLLTLTRKRALTSADSVRFLKHVKSQRRSRLLVHSPLAPLRPNLPILWAALLFCLKPPGLCRISAVPIVAGTAQV